jgi:hypothetical protein
LTYIPEEGHAGADVNVFENGFKPKSLEYNIKSLEGLNMDESLTKSNIKVTFLTD